MIRTKWASVLVFAFYGSFAYGDLLVNGDFEAPAILGPGQTGVAPGQQKALFGNPLLPGYSSGIAGIPNWINSFTNVGYGAGYRDAGLSRINRDGTGVSQYSFINNWNTRLSQVTSHTVTAGDTYTASIDLYMFNASQAGRFQLWAGEPSIANPDVFPASAVLLADVSVGGATWNYFVPNIVGPTNDWFPLSLNYTVPANGAMLGKPLTISFLTSYGSVGPLYWDNAELNAVAVPEPTPLLMSALGFSMVFAFPRTRRRFVRVLCGSVFALGLASAMARSAAALDVFSAGLEVPETISPIPAGFGGLGDGYLVPDPTFDGLTTTNETSKIWYVPVSGGAPSVFAETRLELLGGTFLPSDFGALGGMYLTAGGNDGEIADFWERQQANPNDPSLYPFEYVVQVVAFNGAGAATVLKEYKAIILNANEVNYPEPVPGGWATPIVAPDTFGAHAGDVFYTVQVGQGGAGVGGIYSIDESGTITQSVSSTALRATAGGESFLPFGAVFAPDGFGNVAGRLLISNLASVTAFRILSLDASGNISLFAEFPMSAEQHAGGAGLRQMAFAPSSFGTFGGMLFVSVSAGHFGGGATGQLLAINQSGQVAATLKVGTEFDKFDPRGLYFTDDGRLLISDASDPILVATPADFVVVPEPTAAVLGVIGAFGVSYSPSRRRPRTVAFRRTQHRVDGGQGGSEALA